MERLPKHLQEMSAEDIARIQKGINRFRYGFAEVGERFEDNTFNVEFLGNFDTKTEAESVAATHGGKPVVRINPYLFGKLARGWAVWKNLESTKTELEQLEAIVHRNGVDAWDLGFQGQMSPGAITQAIQHYLTRYGFAQAKTMLTNIRKRGR